MGLLPEQSTALLAHTVIRGVVTATTVVYGALAVASLIGQLTLVRLARGVLAGRGYEAWQAFAFLAAIRWIPLVLLAVAFVALLVLSGSLSGDVGIGVLVAWIIGVLSGVFLTRIDRINQDAGRCRVSSIMSVLEEGSDSQKMEFNLVQDSIATGGKACRDAIGRIRSA